MLWGEPWGCFWGDPEELGMFLEAVDIGDGPRVRLRINADTKTGTNPDLSIYTQDYSQFVRLIVDGVAQSEYVWAPVGEMIELLGVWGSDTGDHVVSVQFNGDSCDPEINIPTQNDTFLIGREDRFKVTITTVRAIESIRESGQLTSWVLTGLQRYTNCMQDPLYANWASLDVTLEDDAGTRTVTLKCNGRTVASGSRAGDGSITLAEQNDSGLSGSVAVAYNADVTSGAEVVIRWPKKLAVHYKTSAFTAPDFPRTAEKYLNDDGWNNERTYRSPILAAGTYHIVVHQQDDGGNESAGLAGGGDTVTLLTPPEPPTSLAYSSGGAAATVIQWTASTTGGATYAIYDSGEDTVINMSAATATHIAGTGTLTQTLPAVSAGWTGTRRVIVRAVNGGVTEGNSNMLQMEYSNGFVIPARPAAPHAESTITVAGRKVTIPVNISVVDESKATPAYVYLFMRAPGGSFDYDSPDDIVALAAAVGQAITQNAAGAALTVDYTHGSDALMEYAVRSATAIGTVYAINGDTGGQTSAWTFTGANASNTNGGLLYWQLADVAGTRTVSVYKGATMASLVAQGSRVGDGSITLTAQNLSGLSGTVVVAYSGDAGNSLELVRYSDNVNYYGPVLLTTTAPADPVQSSEAGI